MAQHEGAVKEDGRGPTIWDTFSHTFGKITDFSNADVAVDQYHRYEVNPIYINQINFNVYTIPYKITRSNDLTEITK